MSGRTLSHDEARTFYDRFGRKQDWQRFYEDAATGWIAEHADLGSASAVVELGCGTGRFAETLLERRLPPDARYLAFDSSRTMVELARARLTRFGGRVEVRLTDGDPHLDLPDASRDRFLSNYVLDLLSETEIRTVLDEAHRVLRPGGLLGLVGLSHGFTLASRLVERVWTAVHSRRPDLVGGCRPIALLDFLASPDWVVRGEARFSDFGIPSQAVVAERSTRPARVS